MNCNAEVASDQTKLYLQVFVCPRCYEMAEAFSNLVLLDLANIKSRMVVGLRHALLHGKLDPSRSPSYTHAMDRLDAMLRWTREANDQQCPSPSTLPESPQPSRSGKPLLPAAKTLLAIGRNSSNSPTE